MNLIKPHLLVTRVILASGFFLVAHAAAQAQALCPAFGWQEGLNQYLQPSAPFPVEDTAGADVPDCAFQQWSAEAFVWATALNSAGRPRFITFPAPEDLLTGASGTEPRDYLKLSPATRIEGAHAFVEADGNLLVAKNGYPVYASVHMNPSYFNTARQNLVKTGAYCSQDPQNYFRVGAAVFKATWLRLTETPDGLSDAPAGAYVTEALVPVLEQKPYDSQRYIVKPVPGGFVKARVALVGLHIVGNTKNHPEFLWATFEHRLNSPRTIDNTFTKGGSDARNFTFYSAGTSFSKVNIANPQSATQSDPQIVFNQWTQTFSQSNQVVQENRTGGASFPKAAQARSDIANVNLQTRQFFAQTALQQSVFRNYDLIGTLWLSPNSYLRLDPSKPAASSELFKLGVGSVNLANSTAETFQQSPLNVNPGDRINCFSCHSAGAPETIAPNNLPGSAQPSQRALEISYCGGKAFPARHVTLSHVLEVGTTAAVPNAIGLPHR